MRTTPKAIRSGRDCGSRICLPAKLMRFRLMGGTL
jgi:hypothetical protein